MVCFEIVLVGATSENPFGNYCLKSVFQCFKNEKSFEKFDRRAPSFFYRNKEYVNFR